MLNVKTSLTCQMCSQTLRILKLETFKYKLQVCSRMNSIATDGEDLQHFDKSEQHTEIDLNIVFSFGFCYPLVPGDLCFFFVLVLVFPLGLRIYNFLGFGIG